MTYTKGGAGQACTDQLTGGGEGQGARGAGRLPEPAGEQGLRGMVRLRR